MRSAIVVVVLASALTGCASLQGQKAYMNSAATHTPEGHSLWARPQEVGYSIGNEISGEATNISILCAGPLCLFTFGAEAGGAFGDIGGAIGGLMGHAAVSDPLVGAAAGAAVAAAGPGVDGIYVTQHETNLLDLLIFKKKTAQVKGRALGLKPLGEVSMERVDKDRFLRGLGGGGNQLIVPGSVIDMMK
jgi:hypothetical protein